MVFASFHKGETAVTIPWLLLWLAAKSKTGVFGGHLLRQNVATPKLIRKAGNLQNMMHIHLRSLHILGNIYFNLLGLLGVTIPSLTIHVWIEP